jgi:hypothetical protein
MEITTWHQPPFLFDFFFPQEDPSLLLDCLFFPNWERVQLSFSHQLESENWENPKEEKMEKKNKDFLFLSLTNLFIFFF